MPPASLLSSSAVARGGSKPEAKLIVLASSLLFGAYLAVGLTSVDGRLVFEPLWISRLGEDDLAQRLLVNWRLPRVIAAAIVGAALALAGLVLQAVTRNPLADPYLLGISGGAGLVVVLLRSLLPEQLSPWWTVPLAGFVGALAAGRLVIGLGRAGSGRLSVVGLVLAGLVVNGLCAALITFVLARLDPFRLKINTTWLTGGIGLTVAPQLAVSLALLVVASVVLRMRAHRLNALALGQDALLVGVDVDRELLIASALSSLLAALGVALAGLLGYVGLLVPHVVRRWVGRDLRTSMTSCAVAGSLLLIVADTVSRVVFAPKEVPVGVFTALLGCPLLLGLLRSQLVSR